MMVDVPPGVMVGQEFQFQAPMPQSGGVVMATPVY